MMTGAGAVPPAAHALAVAHPGIGATENHETMDTLYVALLLVFFLLTIALARACAALWNGPNVAATGTGADAPEPQVGERP